MVRHPGQLAADSVQGKKESAVEHGTENEPGSLRLEISFQRMVSSVLTSCLSSGDNPTPSRTHAGREATISSNVVKGWDTMPQAH
jgi:hypothetical protein